MIYRKTRSARLNLGDYSHLEVFASLELNSEVDDLSRFKDEHAVMEYIDAQLSEFMQDDVWQAREMSEGRDSVAYRLYDLNYPNDK